MHWCMAEKNRLELSRLALLLLQKNATEEKVPCFYNFTMGFLSVKIIKVIRIRRKPLYSKKNRTINLTIFVPKIKYISQFFSKIFSVKNVSFACKIIQCVPVFYSYVKTRRPYFRLLSHDKKRFESTAATKTTRKYDLISTAAILDQYHDRKR